MKIFNSGLLRRTYVLLAMTAITSLRMTEIASLQMTKIASLRAFFAKQSIATLLRRSLAMTLLFVTCNLFAASAMYNFNSKQDEQRFYSLTTNLRCLVCQNQNLLESNAGLAKDLRDNIYTQMNQGKSDKEIINFLVSRYGDFILYQPPVNVATLALWFGPILILLTGLGFLIFYLRKNKSR